MIPQKQSHDFVFGLRPKQSFHPVARMSTRALVACFFLASCSFASQQANAQNTNAAPLSALSNVDKALDAPVAFANAIQKSDVETVANMLAADSTLATQTAKGSSSLPLASAIQRGNVEIIKLLLKNGANPNRFGRDEYYTPLSQAISSRKTEVVEILINAGADINATSRGYGSRYAPIIQAIESSSENIEILKLLMAKGADFRKVYGGTTPLNFAISSGRRAAAEILLDAGAPLEERDARGNTPLLNGFSTSSSWSGIRDVVQMLIERGAKTDVVNKLGITPLHYAAQRSNYENNIENVRFLLSRGANANAQDRRDDTPLHFAVLQNGVAYQQALIEGGANVNIANVRGDTPVHAALRLSFTGWEATLLPRADLNLRDSMGMSPLMLALVHNRPQARDLILLRKPTLNPNDALFNAIAQNDAKLLNRVLKKGQSSTRLADGTTPLHIATLWLADNSVQALLKNGADVNAADAQGRSPLWRIIRKSSGLENARKTRSIITQLLAAGAKINSASLNGDTPLHQAAQSNNLEIVSLLLENKARTDILNGQNLTPLQLLVSESSNTDKVGVRQLVEALIARGADVNDVDNDGNTLLHRAAQSGNDSLVALLLAKGAKVNARNNNSESVLSRAASYNFNPAIIRLLVENGADINDPSTSDGSVFTRLLSSYQFDKSLVQLFISKGFKVNAVIESTLETPLTYAVSQRSVPAVSVLLENGALVNTPNGNGETPLMRMVGAGTSNKELLKLLLDKGADITIRNPRGQTVLDLATLANDTVLIEALTAKK